MEKDCKIVNSLADRERSPNDLTICAKCGEDLTGKGHITKDGKLFCVPREGEEAIT